MSLIPRTTLVIPLIGNNIFRTSDNIALSIIILAGKYLKYYDLLVLFLISKLI